MGAAPSPTGTRWDRPGPGRRRHRRHRAEAAGRV